jgi:acyl-CoA hydrolase
MTKGWRAEYRAKLVAADEAVKAIRSGDNVWVHPGCAEPLTLTAAMTARGPELTDVKVWHWLNFGPQGYCAPEMAGHFRHMALFAGGRTREAVNAGRAEYVPVYLHEVGLLIENGAYPVDVVLCQVTPPDEDGKCSLGVGVDVTLAALGKARVVVAQVNPQVPWTYGRTLVPTSAFTHVVEVDEPLSEMPGAGQYSEVCGKIGANIAALVDDGACLQTGIGEIPDAVWASLGNHKDLGLHSELFGDGIIPLVEKGVLTGARKNLHPGKAVAGFVLASRKLFRLLDRNPLFEFYETHYVNDPALIALHDNMVAINAAIEVDLTGQVCADSIGTSIYSGFGGQVDFIRGAAKSKGGKPIIAITSTCKDDTVSRIVNTLKPGAGVVTNRADVHYVVSEYGVAYLHGKSIQERARALIAIAHPKFREELERAARERHLL